MGSGQSAAALEEKVSAAPRRGRAPPVKVEVAVNADSPLGHGLKSLLSQPLDRLVRSEDAWEALGQTLRTKGFALGAVRAEAGHFTTVDLGRNTLLNEWTECSDSGGAVPVVALHELDCQSQEWIMRKYTSSPPTEDGLEVTHFVKFHERPFRVESWSTRRGTARRPSGKELAPRTEEMLRQVLRAAKVPAREVACRVRSWGVVTEPLDDVLCPDKFWKAFGSLARRDAEEARKAGATLKPHPGGFAVGLDGSFRSACFDKARDEWIQAEHGADETLRQLEGLTITKVHREPFRVQVWSEQPMVRLPGSREMGKHLQDLLGEIITHAGFSSPGTRNQSL